MAGSDMRPGREVERLALGHRDQAVTHQQRRMVAAPHSLVKSCHSLPCPEIQVCSPIAQCFDHLGTKFQLSRCSQGTLCRAPRESGEKHVSMHTMGIAAPPCLLPGLQQCWVFPAPLKGAALSPTFAPNPLGHQWIFPNMGM